MATRNLVNSYLPVDETAARLKYHVGQKFEFTAGQAVICNGYKACIVKVCTGQLTGMVEARVPGGVVCVDGSFPDVYPDCD